MKCPACNRALVEKKAGDVTVDLCEGGCGGVWFDEREIKKFDEPHELDGGVILGAKKQSDIALNPAPRKCPRCTNAVLARQYFDTKNQIEIEQCWTCGGVWLDTGELATIRSQFSTEKERHEAGDAFVRDVLSQHSSALKASTSNYIAEMDRAYENRFTALISSFRSLLGKR